MPLAKPTPDTPDKEPRSFAARAAHDEGHQVHAIEGLTFQEAAMTFVEHWFPPTNDGDEVSVVVIDTESGQRQCFRIDLDSGDAGPCA